MDHHPRLMVLKMMYNSTAINTLSSDNDEITNKTDDYYYIRGIRNDSNFGYGIINDCTMDCVPF